MIEYRDASYRSRPYGGGRLIRRTEATWGKLTALGKNRTEAKAAMMAAVEEQLANIFTRRYLRTDDVTFCLSYAAGWRYDIVRGDGHRSSSTLLGDTSEHEAMDSMRRHFEQYVSSIEFERGVDRTNGELDAAVIAYREDPSEANRERNIAAMQAHVEAFHRELVEKYQDASHA